MDHPHNEILFWTVEGGIIPLLGILFIVGSFLNIVWKAKKNRAWSLLTVLLPITIHEAINDRKTGWEIYNHAKYLYPGAKWRDEN